MELYLILKLDLIRNLLILISFSLVLFLFGACAEFKRMVNNKEPQEDKDAFSKFIFKLALAFAISVLLFVFTPSTKEAAFLKIAPEILKENFEPKTIYQKQYYELGKQGLEEKVKK
jgi:hypothetical protein